MAEFGLIKYIHPCDFQIIHGVKQCITCQHTKYYNITNYNRYITYELLWTPAYGPAKAGQPVRTYIQQLCEDTGCSPEDLPEAMNDREKW